MEQWNSIRQRVLRDGVSIRQIQRETGLHFKTIKKILSQSCPPPFKSPERVKPKIGPYLERIAGILESDMALPKKQRHTAKRVAELGDDEAQQAAGVEVGEVDVVGVVAVVGQGVEIGRAHV